MEYAVLGWPEEGPTLRLDYQMFSYAGKFIMSNTGKAITCETRRTTARSSAQTSDRSVPSNSEATSRPRDVCDDEEVVGAVAFDADRTDSGVLRLRYVTVREDRRGEGVGPELLAFVANRAPKRGFERMRIAVNNPFAYEACYKAGFANTGETTGIAELLLERSAGELDSATVEGATGTDDRPVETYRAGLAAYRKRELSAAEREFVDRALDRGPPPVVEAPD